ncbi:uncharacterized protein FOMMEDRAFT_118525 [Fomitiporia mediterranea MF3/22]|uniref:uncharacterized protein n=1 Tax=Fomitiporia mediterranea (strain MF3/22) TaxID=694068 RepID=UPI00044097D1|nr:uncharacterized protein FOMMEDRAFT_118525 [Fomitiporia mediterranea MF3/22]EJD05455.1 hypothetical protein FOMMEDRAFT_118525 [Fomitiporia mediterranea MF3/22]
MDIDLVPAERPDEVVIKSSPVDDTWPDRSDWGQDTAAQAPLQETSTISERPLNVGDALFYLDSVKKQFADSPGVYNKFLDIMKDFKNQSIDTPGVIQRVSTLFAGYPQLIEGFNTFLPAGYRIECTFDGNDTNVITVTTPGGTTTQSQSADAGSASASAVVGDNLPYTHEQIFPAMEYVTKIKQRFAGREELYQEFIDILNSYKRSPVDQDQLAQRIADLFQNSPDLLSGLQNFVPREMFNALDAMSVEKDVKTAKQVKKAPGDSSSLASTAPSTQKRKRKVPVRDKEKEKERERDQDFDVSSRAAQSRTKRTKYPLTGGQDGLYDETPHSPHHIHERPAPPQPRPGPSTYDEQPVPIMAAPSQNEMHFFDRVRIAIDNRDVYNEFLKLINLFTQEIIDMRRLVEQSRTFLVSEELWAQFKEILGWDSSWEAMSGISGASASVNGEGLERLSKEQLSIRCGPSYRRLPPSEANVPCSGRDEMCKSVLNDEWVTHPTWASEDSGFYTHKKNAYEEALHRSEEERHEYDFHIEAISRTIATLEPFHLKIMQLSPEERATSKQKMPLSGVNKAIHQRIIKKIYGREAGLEVIQAMHDSPAIAIPIVFARLKQKEEEWKKAQREWNKVWREIDSRNYQKSLDHQGIIFKASDKKAITAKTFLNQIESAREEQMSRRASLIDPLFARTRPRYHMAFVIEDTDVLSDLFKLTFSLLDRMQHHISVADRRRIEGFLRSFVPMFFMLDPATFDSAFRLRNQQVDQQYFLTDDFSNFIDEADDNASVVSSSRSGRNGRRAAGSDLRKKLLKTNAQDKSRRAVQNAQSNPVSRLASPVSANLTLVDENVSSEPNEGGYEAQSQDIPTGSVRSLQNRRGSFFTNATFYTLLRLIELLYSRLLSCKDLANRLANDPSSPYRMNPLASDLGLLNTEPPDQQLAEIQKLPLPAVHFYPFLLETCERLFDNVVDPQMFEDITRYMFGTKAYITFTIDKVIGAIIKQVQNIIADSKSLVILEGLKREREMSSPSSLDLDEIRGTTEKVLASEENLFRLDWTPDSHTLTIQLLGKDDATFDDYDVYSGRWQAYIDSFVSDETTRGFAEEKLKPPFLTRNYRLVKKTPLTGSSVGQSGLEIKVCVQTYRMFFVSETEDFFWRSWSAEEVEQCERRSSNRSSRSKRWLRRFDDEGGLPR